MDERQMERPIPEADEKTMSIDRKVKAAISTVDGMLANTKNQMQLLDRIEEKLQASEPRGKTDSIGLLFRAVALLRGLKKGGVNGCWCEMAIGNPNFRAHTPICQRVQVFIRDYNKEAGNE